MNCVPEVSQIAGFYLSFMSQQYLIVDGHSVIFAWPELKALHHKRTALAREELVRVLTHYQDYTGVNVVLVFDGKGVGISHEFIPGGIQVFYSDRGRTADDLIERLVAKYGKTYLITVATSDLMEQQTVISFGADCVSAETLHTMLANAHRDFSRDLKRRNRS